MMSVMEANENEKKIMAKVSGWEVGKNVYNTTWMAPAISVRPRLI